MIEEQDLDAAVAAGVIDAATRDRLLAFGHDLKRGSAGSDDESFRLLTGFNDIFVAIAIGLLLVAVGSLAGLVSELAAPLALAVISWALAEYFTRQRRMALPSILLLLTFVGSVFYAVIAAFGGLGVLGAATNGGQILEVSGMLVAAGSVPAAAAILHWRRFKVPITVAAGAAAASLAAISLLGGVLAPAFAVLGTNITSLLVFACGVGVFALAMAFDGRDPARITRRSDVAFWLHMLAAPMLVHPLFIGTGLGNSADALAAAAVVLAFAVLTAVALAIDRRALIVSALGYAIYAIRTLVEQGGDMPVGSNVALLLVGFMLVLLSAAWRPVRAILVQRLPANWQARLPHISAGNA